MPQASSRVASPQTLATDRWLSPRIWRSPRSDFHGNDALSAAGVYDAATLAGIRAHGFDAIWVRGRLRDLMLSSVFPELNQTSRAATLASLQQTLTRAAEEGMQVFLFFNEPLALLASHPFWDAHPELRGARHRDYCADEDCFSLCTSVPEVQTFLRDAIASVVRELPGLGGVIQITASEFHTHCWSHHARHSLEDGFVHAADQPLDCPRCAEREPAAIVGELAAIWEEVVHQHLPQARILMWNWSWSMWYADPQPEVIEALPAGVDLMADFERGGLRPWRGSEQVIDEYCLGFVGPGDRFIGSQAVANRRGLPMHAKLQLGTTHEVASVPNLPLIANLHAKCVQLLDRGVQGTMGTWAIGCSLTMNTFAIGLFGEDPQRYRDANTFFDALAHRYLGLPQAGTLAEAWRQFQAAFNEFPFSIPVVYMGPVNIAPGLKLDPHYRAAKLQGTWHLREDYGDKFIDACHPFEPAVVVDALKQTADRWQAGLPPLIEAMNHAQADPDPVLTQRRFEETSCARMIGHQLRSAHHVMAFHQWQLQQVASLQKTPPCDLPLDEAARTLIAAELENTRAALPRVESDPRLGWHDEAHGHQYDAGMLRTKIAFLESLL